MSRHQQLVASLGATVVVTDSAHNFFIAEHPDADDEPHEEIISEHPPSKAGRLETTDFGTAVRSLLTSTTCFK